MPQSRPVVRKVYWPALLPQFLAIVALSAPVWFLLPSSGRVLAVFIGSITYWIWCVLLRWLLVSDHRKGMQAYRQGRFEDAISHFEASHRFFSTHRQLDNYRSLLFGVSSRNPYRIISLNNMAYCYSQLGNKTKALELYESVLREMPDHAAAQSSLNLLRAASAGIATQYPAGSGDPL